MLDAHSTCFIFPPDKQIIPGSEFKVAMVRPEYVDISPPVGPQEERATQADGKWFRKDNNFYYPDKIILLESMIRTLLKEEQPKMWKSTLEAWAVSDIRGYLDVELDALAVCEDEDVKTWYNAAIKRDQRGLDRTKNRRTGRAY